MSAGTRQCDDTRNELYYVEVELNAAVRGATIQCASNQRRGRARRIFNRKFICTYRVLRFYFVFGLISTESVCK